MTPDAEFTRQVKDALTHFYDFAHLQRHPLSVGLPPDSRVQGASGAEMLRATLVQAIEALNPGSGFPRRSLQARLYHILHLRYIGGLSPQEVMHEMALGPSQFYREQQRAIRAIANTLWERGLRPPQKSSSPTTLGDEPEHPTDGLSNAYADLEEVAQSTLATIAGLLDAQRVAIRFPPLSREYKVNIDRTLLRQILINLIVYVVGHAMGVQLTITVREEAGHIALDFSLEGTRQLGTENATDANRLRLIRQLAAQAKVQADILFSSADGGRVVSLRLPFPKRAILVIDDNSDAIQLIRRCLVGQEYRTVGAASAQQGIQLARELKPQVILLDVMMPSQDGWEMLQTLKNSTDLAHIPVIIISVLNDPYLARSLGAQAFLHKPFSRQDLLKVLSQQVR